MKELREDLQLPGGLFTQKKSLERVLWDLLLITSKHSRRLLAYQLRTTIARFFYDGLLSCLTPDCLTRVPKRQNVRKDNFRRLNRYGLISLAHIQTRAVSGAILSE